MLHSLRVLCKLTFTCGVLGLFLPVIVAEPPRLVLQITVDALRGDLPQRHLNKMGKGSFRYLIDHGVSYINARYQHGNTETVVGRSSLATGTIPAIHGMVGNLWFDRNASRLVYNVYNVENSRYHLLNKDADVDKGSEIDPTQRAATVDGRSPDHPQLYL
jgi:predicted AlkP superfamily pyrophosphatase or phosphodiesterase